MNTTVEMALGEASRRLKRYSESPSSDAQLLLGEALNRPRAWILSHPESELRSDQAAEFEASVNSVLNGAALPYVLGWWEFFGRRFILEPQVLIPRPETELMVEEALGRSSSMPRILDLGTGSGCIAVTLALELPQSCVYASDMSWEALRIARRNAIAHGVDRSVTFVHADLAGVFEGPFDLVCANLPYIATSQLPALAVANREPIAALDGGSHGTQLIHQALEELPRILAAGGCALFEIDPDQAGSVLERAKTSFPSATLSIATDLARRDRLLIIERA
ncbi:MAG: peptide chain release factor N(5)-glutamine methyltransferase [Anaerolineales bacterium]